MNIREFAKLCGVAHSTVSRALNLPQAKSRVGKETYDRIRAKAAEVGFQVNYYAQALHSKSSNCFGFITGNRIPMLSEMLLFGISQTLNPQRKNLSIHLCDEAKEVEEAFDKMMFYNADAVFYIPPLQQGKKYSTRYMDEIVDKYPQFPPVIILYGGTDVSGFFQIRLRDYETGKRAALRQLECGCRKFAVITSLFSNFMNREMIRGYRETLLAHGVPVRAISELFVWHDEILSDTDEQLKDVDGIWCSHFLMLLLSAPSLLNVPGDRRKLHVDSPCGVETEEIYMQFQPYRASGKKTEDFRHTFGSLVIYQYKMQDIGKKGAQIALQLSQSNASKVPMITYLDVKPVLFNADN